MKHLGNPQDSFKSIIVGGTNGKGSTCNYLSHLFKYETTLKVGKYTSPHLINFNERYSINNTVLNVERVNKAFDYILKEAKSFEENHPELNKLTEFELYTATGFLLFKEEGVDLAILEVGMGGRLDATNIVKTENTICSIITNISLDHTDFLGDTIEKIAQEKAGIIKENNLLITAADEAAFKVLKETANNRSCKIIKVEVKNKNSYIKKNILLAEACWKEISCKLGISPRDSKESLTKVGLAGRFQLLEKQGVLLDCAHNEGAARELKKLIQEKYSNKKIVYIIGMLNKDYKSFVKELITKRSTVICVEPTSERATKKEMIAKYLKESDCTVILANSLSDGISLANKEFKDLIVITGSLYLIGEALNLLS